MNGGIYVPGYDYSAEEIQKHLLGHHNQLDHAPGRIGQAITRRRQEHHRRDRLEDRAVARLVGPQFETSAQFKRRRKKVRRDVQREESLRHKWEKRWERANMGTEAMGHLALELAQMTAHGVAH